MYSKVQRLAKRLLDYSLVGVSTFLLDLLLIYILKSTTTLSETLIIGSAFGVAVTINFFLSYYFVFKGTKRDRFTGYLYFIAVAVIGMQVIIFGTQTLQTELGIGIYAARIIVSGIVGLGNFTFNTFVNFKMFR